MYIKNLHNLKDILKTDLKKLKIENISNFICYFKSHTIKTFTY